VGRPDPAVLAGRALGARRVSQGLSQAQIARAAGITPTALSRIETGKASPTLRTLDLIAAALGHSLTLTLGTTTPGTPGQESARDL
jgi:transcriptional regulator with XRE-family HTH domain